jgi:hypothetical protein
VYFKLLKYNNGKKDGDHMNFLTVKEAGKRWGITGRMVTYCCVTGRIPGAIKKGNLWHVPCEAENLSMVDISRNPTKIGVIIYGQFAKLHGIYATYP